MDLVLTVIGRDRPGLVESISRAVAARDANWMESRMASLAGQFAGILRVDVAADRADALVADLQSLASEGLRIVVERSEGGEAAPARRSLELELVGQDHPGIVRDISRALAGRGVNVDELQSGCESAPMSGEPLFRATARLRLPDGVEIDELRDVLEELADDLMVDVKLEGGA